MANKKKGGKSYKKGGRVTTDEVTDYMGSTLSGMGTGASIGAQIGGPLGAAIGGAAGFLGSAIPGMADMFRKDEGQAVNLAQTANPQGVAYMRDGGMARDVLINVERDELEVEPSGKIVREFKAQKPHARKNRGEPDENFVKATPGNVIIPKRQAEDFKSRKFLRQGTLRDLTNRKLERDMEERLTVEGFGKGGKVKLKDAKKMKNLSAAERAYLDAVSTYAQGGGVDGDSTNMLPPLVVTPTPSMPSFMNVDTPDFMRAYHSYLPAGSPLTFDPQRDDRVDGYVPGTFNPAADGRTTLSTDPLFPADMPPPVIATPVPTRRSNSAIAAEYQVQQKAAAGLLPSQERAQLDAQRRAREMQVQPAAAASQLPTQRSNRQIAAAYQQQQQAATGRSASAAAPAAASAAPAAPAASGSARSSVPVYASGQNVRDLQNYFNSQYNAGLTVDGALGPKTLAFINQQRALNGQQALTPQSFRGIGPLRTNRRSVDIMLGIGDPADVGGVRFAPSKGTQATWFDRGVPIDTRFQISTNDPLANAQMRGEDWSAITFGAKGPKDKKDQRQGLFDDMTAGDKMGMASGAAATLGNLALSIGNRLGDADNYNHYRGAFAQAQGTAAEAVRSADRGRNLSAQQIALQRNTTDQFIDNSNRSQGVRNAMRANAGAGAMRAQAQNAINYDRLRQQALMQLAGVQGQRSMAFAQGDQQRFMEDKMDRDQFYNNLSATVAQAGQYGQQTAATMNQALYNQILAELLANNGTLYPWTMGDGIEFNSPTSEEVNSPTRK